MIFETCLRCSRIIKKYGKYWLDEDLDHVCRANYPNLHVPKLKTDKINEIINDLNATK